MSYDGGCGDSDCELCQLDAEVAKLEQFIGGKMYSVTSSEPRGLQIAVVIPYGTSKGWRTLLLALRQFFRSARPALLPQTQAAVPTRHAGGDGKSEKIEAGDEGAQQ